MERIIININQNALHVYCMVILGREYTEMLEKELIALFCGCVVSDLSKQENSYF